MVSRRTPGHSSPVTLQLVGPTSWTEVPALLCYDSADPYAVRIAFGDTAEDDVATDPDGAITWLLSRELLQAGLDRPAGDGDVRLWPARAAADVLYLHLRAPSGEALFEVSRASVAAFLRHTEALVPLGEESARLGLDDELEALLSNGGADPSGR
jgi:Streptomyces sporulation and cell division protein, SsgA